MKPKNAPKSRKTHCLVGFFAAKTGQNRTSAGNFGFAPKNFYRKFRCLSPKFFGAGCYTNFLRKNAVFHGRAAYYCPEHVRAAKIRREKPKFCRVYGVKHAVFLHNAGKRLRRQPVGVKNLTAMAGWTSLFYCCAAELCMAAFCLC